LQVGRLGGSSASFWGQPPPLSQCSLAVRFLLSGFVYAPPRRIVQPVGDNYQPKSHKYVRITTYQPDTKSNHNPSPITKQRAIVNIQQNIVTCPTYPQKCIRENAVAPSVRLQVVIVRMRRSADWCITCDTITLWGRQLVSLLLC